MQPNSIRRQAVGGVWGAVALALVLASIQVNPASAASYTLFESGQVRPLALSPDGTHLFAVNSPDNRLEIFSVDSGGLTKTGEVGVGMEPVAVAARTNTEVWVVNHLSDSISIVDVSGTPQVVRTLLVGDEPRDIVFAGPGGNRAFITTARRGQNVPVSMPPNLTTPSTPRALVWVFDANSLGSTLEGVPLTILALFGDTPRALAVSPDGNTVYAAVFESGNQTATVTEGAVCDDSNLGNNRPATACTIFGKSMPGGLPNPEHSVGSPGDPRPEVGLVVRYNGTHWVDGICGNAGTRAGMECQTNADCPSTTCTIRNWDNAIPFTLPDLDVFKIDATANPPAQIGLDANQYAHVGTVLFNMITNPVSGKVYVSNTDANNKVRFEGIGVTGGSTVRGHLHEARITVLDGVNVLPRHLNKHIDYSTVPSPMGVSDASIATPVGMAVSSNGSTLYLAGFGSQKIGVYSTSSLESDGFFPPFPGPGNAIGVSYVPLTAGGPTGLALDETHHRLYVLTRFDNSVHVVDTMALSEETMLAQPLYNPEPATILNGRHFLYDAAFTSSNGEASCSSCHIFGDFDSLAWDLGDPDNVVTSNPNPFRLGPFDTPVFHPMKGPMTTQSLRGMVFNGPMHWRGDRTAGNDPGGNPLDSFGAFEKFNVAFSGLLGRSGPLVQADMDAFTTFILQETYPPNPIRNLDNSLVSDPGQPDSQLDGQNFYLNTTVDTLVCNGCHKLNTTLHHFGTDGDSSFEGEPQEFKIPHLRNAYQKVGMFGMPQVQAGFPGTGPTGPQVRGFGFLHDGSVDNVFDFLHAAVFTFSSDVQRRQVESFVLAFPSDLAPIIGQQVTLTNANNADSTVTNRLDLFDTRSMNGECDVIVKGIKGGIQRGWVRAFGGGGTYRSDRASEPQLSSAGIRALTNTVGQDLTFTAVPVGAGVRMGIDRDEDGFLDRDEIDAGSDPANPSSTPSGGGNTPTVTDTPTPTPTGNTPTATATNTGSPTPELVSVRMIQIKNALPDDESKNKIIVLSQDSGITVPAHGANGDPTCNSSPIGTVKATLTITSFGSSQTYVAPLPCQNWQFIGSATSQKGYKYKDPALVDSTAKIVIWKPQKELKAVLMGKGPTVLSYDLQVGVSQVPVAVKFSSGIDICAACSGASKTGSDGKEFLAKQCSAPLACP
jgi:YVTN family beta-propeller protein